MRLAFTRCRCDGPRWHRRLQRAILTGSGFRLGGIWRSIASETPVGVHATTVRTDTDDVLVLPSAGDIVVETRKPALAAH